MVRSLLSIIAASWVAAFGRAADTPSPPTAFAGAAVAAIGDMAEKDRSELLKNIKAATDGIQFAVVGATTNDMSKMLKGIGDAVAVLPGVLGYAGIAFSLAASVAALLGASENLGDPVLTALHSFQNDFQNEMAVIRSELEKLNDQVSAVIANIDHILDDISLVPAKVVAEMQLTDITITKDKFSQVQQSSADFAKGKLTTAQMISKCDDYDVATHFSELETVLKDEKNMLSAKFGQQDRLNGKAQLELLVFYMSVIPLVSNCNALKYPLESVKQDGGRMEDVIATVWKRASWYLVAADRTIHVRERFDPFGTEFDGDGYRETSGFRLSLSFKAFSFAPPHSQCFTISASSTRLTPLTLAERDKVPNKRSFCVKNVATDDAPNRMVYAEREGYNSSIIQPEMNTTFDPLPARGWTKNLVGLYSPKIGHWRQLPRVTLVDDFQILQAENDKVELDQLTNQCRGAGTGYNRDGDGHSKDYSGAPWTIFCVKYAKKSVREVTDTSERFLVDAQLKEMDAGDAWEYSCPSGYVRDKFATPVPSKVDHGLLGGTSTVKSYAVCLKWGPLKPGVAPNHFVERIWLNDSLPMADKPRVLQNEGKQAMQLPTTPKSDELAAF